MRERQTQIEDPREQTKKKIDQLTTKQLEKMRTDLETFGPKILEIEKAMKERQTQIEDTKDKMNTVEDRIFKKFCSQIGVTNIRQYEERELKSVQDRAKKKMEFDNQINRITTQLEYEQKREDQLRLNVEKFERTVQDDEDVLETAKNTEQQQMSGIDNDMREVDKAKQEKSFLKTKVDNERANRHSILIQCKMDNIAIPMSKGNLDDIDEGEGDDPSIEVSGSQPSHVIYEREANIKIDYGSLEERLTELEDNDDVKKVEKSLEKQINELQNTITRIQAPNMRAMQRLDEARDKLEETNKEFELVRKKTKASKQAFERLKQERYDLFMKCFEHVSNTIDEIYKALAKNLSAQAFLGPENPEEPYLAGLPWTGEP